MTVDDPQSAEFDDLLLNLDRQSALYDRLYDLSERERAAIAGADLIQLAALVAEKEQIVAEAQRLERRRDAMCRQWARQRGMDGAPTLNDVRGWAASPAVRARLDAAAVSLSRRVSRLRQVNARNADILAQTQRMNEHLLANALRYARHPLYTPQGDTASDRRASIICDYRA